MSEIVREADLLLSSSARACNVLATEVDVHSQMEVTTEFSESHWWLMLEHLCATVLRVMSS